MDKEEHSANWKCLDLVQKKSNSYDWKVTFFAVLLSIFLHVSLYMAIPEDFGLEEKKERYEDLELEILPPPVAIKQLPQYIEANPYANEEKPKDTVTKESFQDQRAADMVVDVKSDSDKPFIEGEVEESQKIISGKYEEQPVALEAMEISEIVNRDLAPPNVTEISSEQRQKTPTESQVKKLQENATKDLDFDGDDKALAAEEDSAPVEGEKTEIAVKEAGESAIEDVFTLEEMEESGDIKIQKEDLKDFNGEETSSENLSEKYAHKGDSDEDLKSQQKQSRFEKQEQEKPKALPTPKKRPSINMKVTSGPLVHNEKRASTVGMVAVDSSFSEFGAYQQRMLEAISRQWNLLASQYNLSNVANSVVVIEFYLNKKGELTIFRVPYSNSSNIATTLCEQAIKTTAPYGVWTEDMIAVFGQNEQSVKITFHYR